MIVTLLIKPGMETQAEELLRQLESETAENDKGCLRYQWYRAEQPGTYYLLERWTNQAAMEAHLKSSHLAKLMPQIAHCAAEKVTTAKLTRLE